MKIKVTENQSFALIQICGNNGEPASPQNPIDEATELKDIDFPEAVGQLAIISGMPSTAQCACTARYKNCFGAIALANPRMGVAFVIHSTTPNYQMGQQIPLA